MSTSPARKAAFDILLRIEKDRAFSSVLLPEYEERLSEPDKRLCHQLTLGVLREQTLLDHFIGLFAGGRKIDVEVRVSLRLGLYQLRSLERVPAHSAVNESVELVKRAGKSSARGFVNALLRRFARERPQPPGGSSIDSIAVRTSHPAWLISRWSTQFGIETAEQIAVSNNKQPEAAFRIVRPEAEGGPTVDAERSERVDGAYLARSVTEASIAAAGSGQIYFQDEGSQVVGNAVRVPHGGKFLDVCAAPGSKTTQIAHRNEGSGRMFVAGDLHSHRVRTLASNCRRQEVAAEIVKYNAVSELPFAELSFDSVLVDAPCSGTGTIRHNPEIRYFLEPDDFQALASKQRRILENASKLVRAGGEIIYSTCSLEHEENEAIAEAFLAGNQDFVAVAPRVPAEFLTAEGFARTFPHADNMDGFFIAAFKRRSV
jgi:16S rRNA (cytosine967-C5)-methyltransferase